MRVSTVFCYLISGILIVSCGTNKKTAADLLNGRDAASVTELVWQPVGPFGAAESLSLPNALTPHGTGRFESIDIHPKNDQEILIGHATSGLFKTIDGGKTWEQKLAFDFATGIFDILRFKNNTRHLLACCATDIGDEKQYGYGLIESFDGGETWQRNSLQYNPAEYNLKQQRNIAMIDKADESSLVSVSNHNIYISTDGAKSWKSVFETKQTLLNVKVDPNNEKCIVVTGNIVVASMDGGETWTDYTSAICQSYGNVPANQCRFEAIFSQLNPDKIYFAVSHNKGYIIQTSIGFNSEYKIISQSNFNGNIYHMDAVFSYDAKSKKESLFLGTTQLHRSNDDGKTFKVITTPDHLTANHAHDDVNAVKLYKDGRLYIATDGGVDVSNDNGETWTSITDHSNLNGALILGFDKASNHTIMAGTQDMGILQYKNNSWKTLSIYGDGGRAVAMGDSLKFAFGYAKMCFLTSNEGISSIYHHAGSQVNFFEFRMQYVPKFDALYIANHHLYKKSGQKNFEILTNKLSTERAIGAFWVNPNNEDEIWLSKTDATWGAPLVNKLYYTNDGGINWVDKTNALPILLWRSISDIDVNASGDIAISLQGFDSEKSERNKVFLSTNGGETFENFSDSLPNFPVLTIEPIGNAWACGTSNGVFVRYARDGWQPLGQGFPATIVTELHYYSEQQLLYASTFGRGIWRTLIKP
ncbi:MAG: hypothetical protein V4613_10295 [Bacteroidota bacterium]